MARFFDNVRNYAVSQFNELRTKGFLNFLHDKTAKGSSPVTRSTSCAFAPIERQKPNGEWETVGTFVLGLYQLAKDPGELKCQHEEQAYIKRKQAENSHYIYHPKHLLEEADSKLKKLYQKLYHPDGTKKTAFELAVLPYTHRKRIQDAIQKEYQWQNEHGYLPQVVFKFRMNDWLGNLNQVGFRIKQDEDGNALVDSFGIDVHNPNPKPMENAIHYGMQWLGWLVTISSILTLSAATNLMLALSIMMTYQVMKSANAFDFFDKAELIWNDVRWLGSHNFLRRGFSWPHILNAAFYATALSFIAGVGAMGVFSATMNIAAFNTLGLTVAAKTGIAYFFAGLSLVASWVGLSIPVRYVDGFSIHDNQISKDEIREKYFRKVDESTNLPKPKILRRQLKEQQELITELKKKVEGLEAANTTNGHSIFAQYQQSSQQNMGGFSSRRREAYIDPELLQEITSRPAKRRKNPERSCRN